MNFKRITYTDSKGIVTNEWRGSDASAIQRCGELVAMGMAPVFYDTVAIPIGDRAALKEWLNSNPNSPNVKHGDVDGSVTSTYVPLSPEMQALVAKPEVKTNPPLVWPEVPGASNDITVSEIKAYAARLQLDQVKLAPRALDVQVAGSHYKDKAIQPVEYMHANGIPFMEGSVIKYMTRWRDKGGIKDLEKAKHFIELLIELEQRKEKTA